MNHHRIVNQCLNIGHGKIPVVLTGESPRHVDGCERHVEVEFERFLLSGLAVSESGKLLAIFQEVMRSFS